MPWEERTVEKSRSEFIEEVEQEEATVTAICQEYGISRKTGYKWLNRYRNGEGLSDRSREPFHTPNKTPKKTEQLILELREARPAWGARKLRHVLEKRGHTGLPAASTICDILKRNGYVSQEESLKHQPYKRFEMNRPNEMWQTDFKGDFGMANKERCHALTVLDDHARYALCVDAKSNQRLEGVQESFKKLFLEYGLPENVLCDNGNPWGASQSTGYTKFEIWLMDLGILTIHGRIRHPQTQGKDERFHRTMDDELLKRITVHDITDAQRYFDEFRRSYNTDRPHQALGYDTPDQHYKPSPRKMPGRIEGWEYGYGCEVRRIKGTGYLTYRGQGYFLSEAFSGKEVALTESAHSSCFDILYRSFRIGQINIEERVIVSRRICRRNT